MMNLELNPTERRVLAKHYAERIADLLSERGTPYDESDQAVAVKMAARMTAIIETLAPTPLAKAA